jgi:hypothetical protein
VAFVGAPPNPVTLFVDGAGQNLGTSQTRGIDFAIDWALDLSDVGHRLAQRIGHVPHRIPSGVDAVGAAGRPLNTSSIR